MKFISGVLLASLCVLGGCATTADVPRHTVYREFEPGEYEIEIRSVSLAEMKGASDPLRPLKLRMGGLAIRRDPGDALVRPKHWIRVDSVLPARSAVPVGLGDENDEFRPGEMGHASWYSADLRGATHSQLIGEREQLGEWVREAVRIAGAVVVYEAAAIDGRLLGLQNAVDDGALLKVVPGVYVGVADVSQDSDEFVATIRFWVSRALGNNRGGEALLAPSVPLSYSVRSHGDPHPGVGSVPRGWRASEITVPVLIEIEFLNQAGEVVHIQPEDSVVLYEADAALLGEIAVRFPLRDGERVTHFNPVAVVRERRIEIPFEIDLDGFAGSSGFGVSDEE